jgi:hypothetical protein
MVYMGRNIIVGLEETGYEQDSFGVGQGPVAAYF